MKLSVVFCPAVRRILIAGFLIWQVCSAQTGNGTWRGVLHDVSGKPVPDAQIELKSGDRRFDCRTTTDGAFDCREIPPAKYAITVEAAGARTTLPAGLEIAAGQVLVESLHLTESGRLALETGADTGGEATGGGQLSGKQVSALPLNKRDFSQLLLLAAGTQTDTNGAANFTQQFTVNGQRGTATVFAMDGIDTTDPEMGGATFSNFNVDAIQEVTSDAGVIKAEIGHGAAQFTNVISKSGVNDLHGSAFEFVRNAVFDARNFFDRTSVAQPGRLPPFNRNEFGFTNGGPVVLPHLYDGRNRTFYFGQYQGFRQVLGTTQVLPVPTAEERQGLDSTAFAGDVLTVPVNSQIQSVLARYPMPNDPSGSYGARTYATSSKVTTDSDQFSIRVDHRISDKAQFFARFNLNNVNGPLTNPSQTAIDPSFASQFFDRQRNFGMTYTRTQSANFLWDASLGYVRSTPNFPTINQTQPGMTFADGLYEPFNSPAGSIMGAYGNLFQFRTNFTWIRGTHTWKAGVELRFNRDTTVFGISPNGTYTFGGGAAYSPVEIRSASGLHDIHAGDPLPDSLTGFLTGTPFSYTTAAAPTLFAQGQHMGDSAVRREAYNFYAQDSWKVSSRFLLNYGLRYEVNSPIKEAALRTSSARWFDQAGQPADPRAAGAVAQFLINTQPTFNTDWTGLGPRVALEYRIDDKTTFRAGGSIVTLLQNLWQDNMVTGGTPYVVSPYYTASPGSPVPFQNSVVQVPLPEIYNTDGQLIYATGNSKDVPGNTQMDLMRFERDLAALSPDHVVRPITGMGIGPSFGNGYVGTWTAALERSFSDITAGAAYVATVGVSLPRIDFPNGYGGADPSWAPYTTFDAAGTANGGYGPVYTMRARSHSSYQSLQTSVSKNSLRYGLGFQASYTFSKSIDDTSAVLGGFVNSGSGTILQASPQDPNNISAEKAPSTFDITQAFSFSVIQEFRLDRMPGANRLGTRFTRGWQLMGMGSMMSGAPFTIFSGIQQTGAGSNGADRPDQVGRPELSTSRTVREDYFGLGANNASFFSIPVDIAGGSGPNSGRFGTLGRNTFRGPGFHSFDVSLIKNTPIGGRNNPERAVLQFRAEFFNIFNIVNFSLPANIVLGPGFGVINRTAGPSRQIQFSLKLLY